MLYRVIVTLCLCSMSALSAIADTASSRYERTIYALQSAPPEWRADFANIAIMNLADAYYSEADLARGDGPQGDKNNKAHWSWSVEQYASRLVFFQRRLDSGENVSFTLSPVTEAILNVGGEQLMLTHPRPEKQSAFESMVLGQFCEVYDCSTLTPELVTVESEGGGASDSETAPKTSRKSVTPKWSFTADGPVCMFKGAQLTFKPGDHSGAVRKICLLLFQDTETLIDGLLAEQGYGVQVDWDEFFSSALSLSSVDRHEDTGDHAGNPVNTPETELRLNTAGDVLRAHLQLLNDKPELLSDLRPWLVARFNGQQYRLELKAAAFGWRGSAMDRYR